MTLLRRELAISGGAPGGGAGVAINAWLKIFSGPPMLAGAAVDAVRQWRYRTYVLNGEAVEVETEITVNFVLSGS
jgi:hypothetical protein